MNFEEIIEKSGMSIKEFSDKFEIPYRTVQSWKSGERKCPAYLLKLLEKECNGTATRRSEKINSFVKFFKNDSNNANDYPYDEFTHGLAIGTLYYRLNKLATVDEHNLNLLINSLKDYTNLMNVLKQRYMQANPKLKLDDKKTNKLMAYVLAFVSDEEHKKTSNEFIDGVMCGFDAHDQIFNSNSKRKKEVANMYNINDLMKNEELFEQFMEQLNSSKFAGVETVSEFLDRFDQLNTSRTVYSLINGRFEDGCIDEELHEQVGHDGYVEVEGYEQVELASGRFVRVYGKAGFDKWSEDYNEYQECGFGDFDRIELA